MTAKKQEIIKVSLGQYLDLRIFRESPNYRYLTPAQIAEQTIGILGAEIVSRMCRAQESGRIVVIDVKEALDHTDEELAGLGYEGLRMLGFTPQQARDAISARLTEEVLGIYRKWNQTSEGKLRLNQMASQWLVKGVLPPWDGRL